MEQIKISYDNKIVKWFLYATIFWGIVGMLVGLLIALQLAFPSLNFGLSFTTFGRVRPVHTNAIIFAFVGNAIFVAVYYSMQRLLKARMYRDWLSWIHFWGWQSIIVIAAVTLLAGFTTSKEYAELEWPVDILITLIWVIFGLNMFGTIYQRRVHHLYVAIWFYIASWVAVAILHIFNSIEIPVSFLKSYPVYAGVQDALVQWWYGHNAVAFFLTTPYLGMLYYFLPKAANRPIYSYKLSILHFWTLIFLYIWAGPHHLLYNALPDWVQSLGVVFSIMLIAPSWGGTVNALLTLRGIWDKVRTDAILKFMVVAVTAYGMSTFEGPVLSLKNVNAISHFTDWTIAHVHIGGMAWNGFLTFAMLYWLIPKLFNTKLFSTRLSNIHFWVATFGILFYSIPLYWAAFTQSLMWKEFTKDGFLANPNFLDTLVQILPMYHTRIVGGVLYFAGAIIMVYNLVKTMKTGNVTDNEEVIVTAPANLPATRQPNERLHGWLERRPVELTVLAFVALFIGGAIEIIPLIMVKSNVPTISSVKPYTPLELHGRDIYIREGCNNCHSQTVRPFRSETERYGEYSKAGEFVYDHPFLFGSRRTGPDLAREGVGKLYKLDSWQYNHLLSPQTMNLQSIMPPYPWLITDKLDTTSTAAKINAMIALGVPYDKNYAMLANADLAKQAQLIADGLKQSIPKADASTEIIALIAYLQRLGKDITVASASLTQATAPVNMPDAPMTSEADLTAGRAIYVKNCLTCHGNAGEGNAIGPNLTDNYWINGGTNDEIYRSVHTGIPAKGMQAWQYSLPANDLMKVSSYVISLIGTNPSNARQPQGVVVERK